MRGYHLLLLATLWGALFSCAEKEPSTSASTSTSTPAPAAVSTPAPQPSGLQPPYPITDSSKIQSVGGIQLYIVEEGNGAIPKPGSNVIMNYHGMLLDGSVFDSSFGQGGVKDFSLKQLIEGWQIGLTKVRTGSKVKLIIPPDLAYGAQARPNIPANSTLIFDIELVSTY